MEGLWHEEEQKIKPPITKANAYSSLNQISKLLNVITIIRKGVLERIVPNEKGKGKREMNKKGNIRKNCPKRKGKGKAMDNSSSNDTTNVVEDISDYSVDSAFSLIAGSIRMRMNGFWIRVVHIMCQ